MRRSTDSSKRSLRKQYKETYHRLNKAKQNKTRIFQYAEYYNAHSVKDIILYEAFAGRGILCNPYALFQAMRQRKDFKKYKHVWVIDDFAANKTMIQEYSHLSNVKFIQFLSDDYLYYLSCSKILINNSTFPSFFAKKESQIYINTWHGIPLKKMGYDQKYGNIVSGNTVRNFLAADYLLSSCDYQTDMYKKAYKLDGIYPGTVIAEGQPRTDLIKNGDRERILEKMKRLGVGVEPDKKIVLFAPTWRGEDFKNPEKDTSGYTKFIEELERILPGGEYQVFVKPHQVVYQSMIKRKNPKFIPAGIDAAEVLAVTDILVADYSSIYFDFLITDRPVFFYIPDYEEYKEERGVYFSPEDLPGPAYKDMEQLGAGILSAGEIEKQYLVKYEKQREQFIPLDNGQVGARIWKILLDGETDRYQLIHGFQNDKKKILAFIGEVRMNGITESFYSLLNVMDYEKFDITVFALLNEEKDNADKIEQINKNARVLTRVGSFMGTAKESAVNKLVMDYGLDHPKIRKLYSGQLYHKEYRRTFGEAVFDFVINYTGYSSYFTLLLLQSKGSRKYIWQHTDLDRDRNKLVHGVKKNQKALNCTISAYPFYDKIISCSEGVMKVNRAALAVESTYDKYEYCRNLVDFQRVFDGMEKRTEIFIDGKRYLAEKKRGIPGQEILKCNAFLVPEEKNINFVTMGRLSPEKNHANMILAFARFWREVPASRLYILGDGPLMKDLKELVRSECCTEAVSLTGNVLNPFAFMKHCHCFLLPSLHEGQPMVILEARAMGLPIIVADFSTVSDSLIENGQLEIKSDADSIYEGLVAFKEGRVPKTEFDYQKYNRDAYREFESLFEEETLYER